MTQLRKPVKRTTVHSLETHGPNRDRPFIVTLAPGDILTLRPLRRKITSEVTILLSDVYRHALMCRSHAARREKEKERKVRKDAAKAQARFRREIRTQPVIVGPWSANP